MKQLNKKHRETFRELFQKIGVPGIKVDKGAKTLAGSLKKKLQKV